MLTRQDTRLDIEDYEGSTPLHLAYRYNRDLIPLFCQDSRSTRDLLTKKELDFEKTPLMQAVFYGHPRSFEELVKVKGFDFSHKNKERKSALDIALEKEHESIIARIVRITISLYHTIDIVLINSSQWSRYWLCLWDMDSKEGI